MPETLTAPRPVTERVRNQEQTETLSAAGREVFLKMDRIVEERLAEATGLVAAQSDKGGRIDNREVFSLARARQERFLAGLTEEEMESQGLHLSDVTAQRLALLTLEVPFVEEAAVAVRNGPKDPKAIRVLSQFNHDIVQAVEYMPVPIKPDDVDASLRSRFADELWLRAAVLCQKKELPMLSRAEFGARVQGMAREAAFVDAVNSLEYWDAIPSDVKGDMQGIDVDITDGEIVISIDLKGDGQFQHLIASLREDTEKLKQLQLTEADLRFAEMDGFFEVTYQHGDYDSQRVWIVDADRLGEVSLFRYPEQDARQRTFELVETLGAVERTELELLHKLGRRAINT